VPFDPAKPFDDLPFLPPSAELETKAVLKKCIAAQRALAELKGAGDLLPDPDMLINAIPLLEAKLSSEIENIVTTHDKLFRAAVGSDDQHDPQTKEVLRYRTALREGFDALTRRPLSVNVFHDICSTLRNTPMSVRKRPGTTLSNPETRAVVYTPPEGEGLLNDLLHNLEVFLHAQDGLDPLVKAAVLHYQFEAIHPYHDGNGRTGRILIILYLVERGVLKLPVLYLSRYLIEHRAEYYRLLRQVTESGAWEPWILYMLTALEETATQTTQRIYGIRNLLDTSCAHARKALPARAYSKELVELVFFQPYTKIQFLVENHMAERKTAAKYLQMLAEIGILKSVKMGKERVFVNPKLVSLLRR